MNSVFCMQEMFEALPKKGKLYGIKDGTKVRHSLYVRKDTYTMISTWQGTIRNGEIRYGNKTFTKPSLFVKAHLRSEIGGKSLSDYEMVVKCGETWIPYSLYTF